MASGGEADCGRIRKEKSKNERLWGEGMRIRRKMNGIEKRSRLRTDPQRKGQGGGGMERREAARARKSEEFWKMKRSRIRHQQKSRVERRWRMLGGWRLGASGVPGRVGYASVRNECATMHPKQRFAPGAPGASDAPGAPGAK